MSDTITNNDVAIVKAIVRAFYGESYARKITQSSVTEETVLRVLELLSETDDCSKWIDAVPNPKDLLVPSNKLRKWSLRVLRNSGAPFLNGNVRINIMCQRFRAAQLRNGILLSLQ